MRCPTALAVLPCLLALAAADEKPQFTNRLAKEKSPYLLQHAHNPVDWYPWDNEAFEKAKRENKPIFLSVGYSTCHWCHVMERESFADPEIAKLINDGFVPVKVDREERPDVDRVYMTYVMAANGSGGWPVTVFLTPDRQPFYGGTYFPPEDRQGMPGIKRVLAAVRETWEKRRDEVVKEADSVAKAVEQMTRLEAAKDATIDAALVTAGYERLAATFDKEFGGFGRAPKFPEPVNHNFLLHYAGSRGEGRAREIVVQSLRAMTAGGVHDHLGGGFHRYSTDRRWFLPHFEKMLYDQALLAGCFVDAYRLTRDESFADGARDILDYVLRDLTGPAGQFYSAEDADSARDSSQAHDKAEGAFYVWNAEEIDTLLGEEAAEVVKFRFGVTPDGNVPAAQDPRKEFPGYSVLYAAQTVEVTAQKFGMPEQQVGELLGEARRKLFEAQSKRPRPHRDDKTIVAWNSLMISAFARAGAVFGEPRYGEAAVRAAAFVRDNLYDSDSRTLWRIWRDGRAPVGAFLDDHAFLTQGLLDLYEVTLDVRWLRWALDLQARQDELFLDSEHGGYFNAAASDAATVIRLKDDQEGAEPAGNSIAALNLLRLAQMTDEPKLTDRAKRVFDAFSGRLTEHPAAMAQMLVAVDFSLAKPVQVVIAGDPASADVRAMLKEVHSADLPNRIILGADGGAGQAFLAQHAEFIKEMKPLNGKATAYVCQNYACQQPTTDLGELRRQLTASRPAPTPTEDRQTGSASPKTEHPKLTPAPSPAPR
jgi:uncharacterized protein YyaL (SSP411 family)